MGWMNLFYSIPLVIGSVLVSALIWWLFARQMTAKTVAGARTRIAVLGFQEFMNRVDADRIKRMPPDTFEKFLPYAMALGVEHHWAQAFDGIIKDPPTGTFRRTATSASVRFSFPVPCTAWRRTCTRSSPPLPEPVLADPASAEEADSQAEAFPEADSAAVAAAPSSVRLYVSVI
jgi:hypothetical protein